MRIVIAYNTLQYVYLFRLRLIERVAAMGHEVIVIGPRDAYLDQLQNQGLRVYCADIGTAGGYISKGLGVGRVLLFMCYWRPDVIFSFTIYPNFLFSIFRLIFRFKLVVNITGLGSYLLSGNRVGTRLIYKSIFSGADKVFFQNIDDAKFFDDFMPLSAVDYEILPGSGVNLAEFEDCGDLGRKVTFGFVGRLIKDKGIEEFFEAVRYLRDKNLDCNFKIFGAPPMTNPGAISLEIVKEYCDELSIDYVGFTDDRSEIYSNLSAVVLPSYREGTSKVLLEACASHIPGIASDVAGCNNVIFDGFNGFLCDVKSWRSVAEAMIKYYQLPPHDKALMGRNARKVVENKFSDEVVLNAYCETLM